MIYINNFSISNDGTTIEVNVETDEGYIIDSATFWTDATFQDPSQGVDITSLLSQANNVEVFSISTSDVGVSDFFDGIFFVEFTSTAPDNSGDCDNCNNPLGVAAKLLSAKICLLEKVKQLDICNDGCDSGCDCVSACDIIVLDNYIDAMSIAIEYGLYSEAIDLLNGIRKLCTTCSECLDLNNFNSNAGLGFYTLDNTIYLQ